MEGQHGRRHTEKNVKSSKKQEAELKNRGFQDLKEDDVYWTITSDGVLGKPVVTTG